MTFSDLLIKFRVADRLLETDSARWVQRIREVFRRHNTILLTSTSVERLFSHAKLVLRRTRQRMGDKHFEAQLLSSATKGFKAI